MQWSSVQGRLTISNQTPSFVGQRPSHHIPDSPGQSQTRFWIVQGRQIVKKLLYKCVICRKLEGRPYQAPPSPPLPEFRVKECSPFVYTGVDFAGPLYVKNHTGPQQKVWICLYIFCVTRAFHLDLVPSLTTSAFLRSLR